MDEANFSTFEALARRLDARNRLLSARTLTGGVSARTTALAIARGDGRTQRLVVHQYGEADLRDNPQIAADEFRLLQIVRAAGIPAPTPYCFELIDAPYLVVEYVEGTTEIAPPDVDAAVDTLAGQLAQIHALDTVAFGFLSRRDLLQDRAAQHTDPTAERIRMTLSAASLHSAQSDCAAARRFLVGQRDLARRTDRGGDRLGRRRAGRSAGGRGEQPPRNPVGVRRGGDAALHGALPIPDRVRFHRSAVLGFVCRAAPDWQIHRSGLPMPMQPASCASDMIISWRRRLKSCPVLSR